MLDLYHVTHYRVLQASDRKRLGMTKRIACLGGGPAGLYFAISMKLREPDVEMVVFERNKPDDTFGWGVVLSDETLDNLHANDPVSAESIKQHFAYWDDIAVHHRGRKNALYWARFLWHRA